MSYGGADGSTGFPPGLSCLASAVEDLVYAQVHASRTDHERSAEPDILRHPMGELFPAQISTNKPHSHDELLPRKRSDPALVDQVPDPGKSLFRQLASTPYLSHNNISHLVLKMNGLSRHVLTWVDIFSAVDYPDSVVSSNLLGVDADFPSFTLTFMVFVWMSYSVLFWRRWAS